MTATFSYHVTGAGWATAALTVDGEAAEVRASSNSPAPEQLLDALTAIVYGAHTSWVSWGDGPNYDRWTFVHTHRDTVMVSVIQTNDADPWFVSTATLRFSKDVDRVQLLTCVVDGFDAMLDRQTDEEYLERWGREGTAGIRERVAAIRQTLTNGPSNVVPQRLYEHDEHPGFFGGWASDLVPWYPKQN